MSLQITSLSAVTAIPIANNDESVALLPLPQSAIIWDATDVNDGDDGSLKPVAFRLGAKFDLKIKGSVMYPPDWDTPANCELIGSVQRGGANPEKIDVFRGKWTQELAGPPTRQGPETHAFEVPLELSGPLVEQKLTSFLPFAIRGDIEWRLTTSLGKLLPTKPTTRLEVYWLCDDAPGGPTTAVDVTNINLQGRWPVGLLRTFVPTPFALVDKVTIETLRSEFYSWWAEHAIDRIGAHAGLSYEAAEGRSGYGVGWTGGSFDLQAWLAKTNPDVNSFDLTALLEAAYSLLVDDEKGAKFASLEARWLCKAPVGTPAPVMPFGWTQEPGEPIAVHPFAPRVGQGSAYSGQVRAVSWLEVGINLKGSKLRTVRVVQATFGVGRPKDPLSPKESDFKVSTAQAGRLDFLKLFVQDPESENADLDLDVMAGLENEKATCYSFDSFKPVEVIQGTFRRRVGLYDLRGVNEPWPLRTPANDSGSSTPFLPMNRFSRTFVANLLAKGNGKSKAKYVSDASLRPDIILPILKGPTQVPEGSFQLKVGRVVSIATYELKMPETQLQHVRISVKIHVYNGYIEALEAMAFELGKFECQLNEVVTNGATVHGDYLLQTSKYLFMVCGNLFVDMTVLSLEEYGTAAVKPAVLNMAGRLSAYLVNRTALPFQARRPAIKLVVDPLKDSFEPLESFNIILKEPATLADEVAVHIARGNGTNNVKQPMILTSLGKPGAETRTLSILVMRKELDKSDNEVSVSIAAAHPDTFFPVERVVKIKIT